MTLPSVLIVDDDAEFAADLMAVLAGRFEFRVAASGEEGLGSVAASPPDAVVLDLMLEGRNGLETLDTLHRTDPNLPVLMVTNHHSGDIETAALNRGAMYYLPKTAGRAEILSKLEKCLAVSKLARENDQLKRAASARERTRRESAAHAHFLASSPALRRIDEEITRIAASQSTVLLTGDSGTGKSLLAEEIHRRSPRAGRPFLRVNMAYRREEVADSELFGHLKGSFTGAVSDRKGYFETAAGGTLFLDEIGDLPPGTQASLLTALEEREILPVGSSVPRRIDVRLICATNRDLPARVREGLFRNDLYQRLCVMMLRMPPLREHPEDIPDLVQYFLGKLLADQALPEVKVSADALERLCRYSWSQGNVRELRNALERALVRHGHRGELRAEDFDLGPDEADPPPHAAKTVGPPSHSGGSARIPTVAGSAFVPPAPGSPQEDLDYNSAKEAANREFQLRFFGHLFAVIGGRMDRPHPDDIHKIAGMAHLPEGTVRRILKELRESAEG